MNDKVNHLNSTVTPDSQNLPQQPVPTDKVDQLENPPSVPNPKLRLHSPVAISTSANDTRITDTHLRPSEDAPVISDDVSSQRALAFQELDNVGKQNWADLVNDDNVEDTGGWETVKKKKKSPSKHVHLTGRKPVTRATSRPSQ